MGRIIQDLRGIIGLAQTTLRVMFFERKEVYYYHDLPTITAHDCSREDKSERAP